MIWSEIEKFIEGEEKDAIDVIYADGQFSCADALTNAAIREPACLTTAYEVVDAVLASTTYIVPEYYMYFSTSQPKTSDFKQIGHHYFYQGDGLPELQNRALV